MPMNRMLERQRPSKRPQVRDIRPAVMVNPYTGISWGEPDWPWGDGDDYLAYPFYGGHYGGDPHYYGGGYEE